MSSRSPSIACLVGMAVVLSGCVSPMIPIPPVTATIPQNDVGTPIADLDWSVAEAEGLRSAYMNAAANISTARELSAATILGLGAAALGIVATHGAGQFPIAAGIGGATLLGLGARTLTTAQQNIYFAGAQALTCALQSQVPILALAGNYTTLRDNVLNLDRAIGAFAALGPTGDDAALLNAAIATDIKARDLLGHMETAGFLLDQQTNAIKIAVDKQTAQSEPDLQSITGVVSGLSAAAGGLGAPGLPSGGPKSPAGPHAGQFTINNLQQARADLNAAVAAVQPLLSRADAVAQVSGTLAACMPSVAAQATDAANKAADAANKAAGAAQAAQKAATDAQAAAVKAATAPPPVRPQR